MAIGAALLFNIKLPQNFNSPYKATGMIDFWKRWHITLTSFITSYIYTPLIKSFDTLTFHTMFATVITFLIAGSWCFLDVCDIWCLTWFRISFKSLLENSGERNLKLL